MKERGLAPRGQGARGRALCEEPMVFERHLNAEIQNNEPQATDIDHHLETDMGILWPTTLGYPEALMLRRLSFCFSVRHLTVSL